jgi:hypothetical protein
MKSFEEITEIVDQISYKDWAFVVVEYMSCIYLQVQFDAPDNDAPTNLERQYGRKWMLSPHMTRSEIVQTALKAVLTAEEHETRERFFYKGCTPFAPHFDVDLLCSFQSIPEEDSLDIRPPVNGSNHNSKQPNHA